MPKTPMSKINPTAMCGQSPIPGMIRRCKHPKTPSKPKRVTRANFINDRMCLESLITTRRPNRYYIEILLFIMIKFFFPSRLDFQAFYHCHPPLSTEKCGHERPLIPVGKAAIARVALYPALWPELRLVPSRSASAHTSRPAILHVNHRPHAASWDNSRSPGRSA